MVSTCFNSIETEGHLLSGSEVKIYAGSTTIKQELAKGQKDNIWLIHEILSHKILKPLECCDKSQQITIPVVNGQVEPWPTVLPLGPGMGFKY